LVDSSFFLGEFLNLGKSPGLACARMNASASAWRFSVSMARLIGPQIGFQYSFDALFDAFFFSGLFLAQALLYSTECSGLFLRQATSETSPLAFLRTTATRLVDALSVRLTCPLSFLQGPHSSPEFETRWPQPCAQQAGMPSLLGACCSARS